MARSRVPHEVDIADIEKNTNITEISTFAKTFNELLIEKRIHQDDLAKATGISTGSISSYRNGKKEPRLSMIVRIANYLGVDCHYLMTGIRAENATTARETGLSAGAICKLQDIYEKNRKTAFSDIISLLIENSNAEYFLAIIAELISCSLDDPDEKEISISGVGFANMELPKEKMIKTVFQTYLIDELPRIVAEYKRQFGKTPSQRFDEYGNLLLALMEKKNHGEITEQEFKELEKTWLKGGNL